MFLFKESLDFFIILVKPVLVLRDTGPRESIAEEWTVSLKTVLFSSESSDRSSIASNWLQISLMKACLLLSCFSLETSSLWHFLALWSPCRLNAQVEFAVNKPVICPAVCTTYNLCHSDILCVLPSYYDIINELPGFGARMHP